MDQRELRRGEGPIALVLVPTRELALQIYTETKRYCKVYNIEVRKYDYLVLNVYLFLYSPGCLRLRWRQ